MKLVKRILDKLIELYEHQISVQYSFEQRVEELSINDISNLIEVYSQSLPPDRSTPAIRDHMKEFLNEVGPYVAGYYISRKINTYGWEIVGSGISAVGVGEFLGLNGVAYVVSVIGGFILGGFIVKGFKKLKYEIPIDSIKDNYCESVGNFYV